MIIAIVRTDRDRYLGGKSSGMYDVVEIPTAFRRCESVGKDIPEKGPDMIRNAFKMKLSSGNIEEYKKRHDKVWPELAAELRKAGISDYSIYYDSETRILFAFQKLADDNTAGALPQNPVVQKWWDYMNDGIMEYNEKNEPVSIPLNEVFHMD